MDMLESALSNDNQSDDMFKARIMVCGAGGGGKKKDPKDMSHDELVAELARRRKGGKK